MAADETLVQLSRNSNWLSEIEKNPTKREYLQGLISGLDEAESVVANIREFRHALNGWPEVVGPDNQLAVFHILRDHSSLVNGQIFGTVQREKRALLSPNLEDSTEVDSSGALSIAIVDEDAIVFVDYHNLRFPMPWGRHGESAEERFLCRNTAVRISSALVNLDSEGLRTLKQELERVKSDEGELSEFVDLATRELQLHSDWSVNCIIDICVSGESCSSV